MNQTVTKKSLKQVRMIILALAVAAFMAYPMAAIAQQEYEYEPGQGLHEEEWYDPGDWFDSDEGIDYERDWYDYTYQYPYTYDYDYDYDYPGRGYYGDDEFETFGDEAFESDYDYYTDTWFEDEDEFDEWYD